MLTWPDVCQWVLGRPAPLWPLLFEQPLLERAKQLVGRDFSAVVDEVTELLGAALQVRGTLAVCLQLACCRGWGLTGDCHTGRFGPRANQLRERLLGCLSTVSCTAAASRPGPLFQVPSLDCLLVFTGGCRVAARCAWHIPGQLVGHGRA